MKKMKVKQMFKGHFLLFCWVFMTMICFAHQTQNRTTLSSYISLSEDDTSKNKSFVQKCANFGDVNCNSNEAGGICGNITTAEISDCSNTGNIQGNEKVGGISGSSATSNNDSSYIRHCFNSGQVNAGSQAGGMLGYMNGQTNVLHSYNIGNIIANNYAGGIIGRKYSQNANLAYCFYDKQMCLVNGVNNQDQISNAEGKNTLQILGDSMSSFLDTVHWTYNQNRYPQLRFGDSCLALKAATTPLILHENEDISFVSHPFFVENSSGLNWETSDSNSIHFKDNMGIIIKSDSDITVSIGDNTYLYKQIRFYRIQPLPSTPLVLYDTICRGESYRQNGFDISDSLLAGLTDFEYHDSLKNQYGGDSIRSLYLHIRPIYNIVLHSNNGTGNKDTVQLCGNSLFVLPDSLFFWNYHILVGWAYNDNGKTYIQNGDSVICSNDTDLYAIWQTTGEHPDYPLTIDNREELIAFRDAVNNYKKGTYKGIDNQSTGYKDRFFKLTTDIDLDTLYQTKTSWIPIGKANSNSFRGNFDGGNHSVTYLYIDNSSSDYMGLFGYLDSGARVSNIHLASNDTVIGRKYCGGIAGFAGNNVVISHCINEAYIEGYGESTGGILGKANYNDTLIECANYAHITGDTNMTGGICGNLSKSVIIACINTGYIQGNDKAGGLCGYSNGNSVYNSMLYYSYNSGQVRGIKNVGGLIGNAYSNTKIYQSYHSGQIEANTLYGSLIGQKSQKTVDVSQCCYDKQISPYGAINQSDDSSALGIVSALISAYTSTWNTNYWDNSTGIYPQLVRADSNIFNYMAIQGIILDSSEDCRIVFHDFQLSECTSIQWSTNSSNLIFQQCTGHISASDSLIHIQSIFQGKMYKEWYIQKIVFRKCDTLLMQVCAMQPIDTLGHNFIANRDTVIQQNLNCIQGGDSLITAIIDVLARYEMHFEDTICQGESYHKNGFSIDAALASQEGILHFTDSLLTYEGCDSIRALTLYIQPVYIVHLLSGDSSNISWNSRICGKSYWKIDTLPFQKAHHNFIGWSLSVNGNADLLQGDSIYVESDTNLYAVWMPDGLSAEYALTIESTNEFIAFRNAVNDYNNGYYKGVYNNRSGYSNNYFRLSTDIDLKTQCDSLHQWEPIGKSTTFCFKGHFEGDGHSIDYLYIDSSTLSYKGIFGCVDSGEIANITLGINSVISANKYVGGIVGYARNRTFIHGCANHAQIEGNGECVGGICGYLQQSTIQECFNSGRIQGNEKVGGIVGSAGASDNNGTSVSYCFNSNYIQGNNNIGGIIGFLNGKSNLQKAYNCGQLAGNNYTGSIVGRKYNSDAIVNQCFYDKQMLPIGGINGIDASNETTGCYTSQMTGSALEKQLGSQYWVFNENKYPQLQNSSHSFVAQIATVPVFLTIPECTEWVKNDFLLGEWQDMTWISSNENCLRINQNRAEIIGKDSMVHLQAVWKGYILKDLLFKMIDNGNKIKEIPFSANIKVFPNPTHDICHVIIEGNEGNLIRYVQLHETSGKIVYQCEIEKRECVISMENLPKGTYLLCITDNSNSLRYVPVVLQ